MPIPTYQQATTLYHGWTKELIELLAIMVSGQNPDGSAWALATSGGGGVASAVAIQDGSTTQKATVTALGELLVKINSATTLTITGTVAVSSLPAVAQGTAAATAGAWPIKITDGTNTALVSPGGELYINVNTAVTQAIPVYIGQASGLLVQTALQGPDPNLGGFSLLGVDQNENAMVTQGVPKTATPATAAWWLKIGDGSTSTVYGTSAAHPLRTDPTGTTTQPVSGAVTTTPSGSGQEHVIIDQGPLLNLILFELRKISLLISIASGVEVQDIDVPMENLL